jgi:trehalose 6-phosphate phosphatase
LQFEPSRKLTPSQCALFLDFDGTLVDIAVTPQSITVPPGLEILLTELRAVFETRLCIVSGRTISDIRHYLNNAEIDIIAEHGAITCCPGLKSTQPPNGPTTWPASWKDHLLTVDHCIPNLVVEIKQTAVALHYRQQPELQPEVIQFADLLRNHAPTEYAVVNSNMTTEIRRTNVDKGTAITAAMQTPRYSGKTPIFIADDATDIPGFNAVKALGGMALHVGTDFDGKPANVRHWLTRFMNQREAA